MNHNIIASFCCFSTHWKINCLFVIYLKISEFDYSGFSLMFVMMGVHYSESCVWKEDGVTTGAAKSVCVAVS